MVIETDFPVFPFRADWTNPLVETISFQTGILQSVEGAEQRRALRETPRRTFEVDLVLIKGERTFYDLFMNKYSGSTIYAPLYWEVVPITQSLTANITSSIVANTVNSEWAGTVYSVLVNKDARYSEVVQIASITDSLITFTAPVANQWPKGSTLLPLRKCVIDQTGDLTHSTAAVATVSLQLRVLGANPRTPAADPSPVYLGVPVYQQEPNWIDDLTVGINRNMATFDPAIGLSYQYDAVGRALLGQAYSWFLRGRDDLAAFRDTIYRNQGCAKSFWLPTFKADFKLLEDISVTDTTITVESTGFVLAGGVTDGREYIAIKLEQMVLYAQLAGVTAGPSPDIEILHLTAPLGYSPTTDTVLKISFMDSARFDSDDFAISHFAGLDSLHTITATFRTIKNTRTAPLPIYLPIPDAVQTLDPCGFITPGGPPTGRNMCWFFRAVNSLELRSPPFTPAQGSLLVLSIVGRTRDLRDGVLPLPTASWDPKPMTGTIEWTFQGVEATSNLRLYTLIVPTDGFVIDLTFADLHPDGQHFGTDPVTVSVSEITNPTAFTVSMGTAITNDSTGLVGPSIDCGIRSFVFYVFGGYNDVGDTSIISGPAIQPEFVITGAFDQSTQNTSALTMLIGYLGGILNPSLSPKDNAIWTTANGGHVGCAAIVMKVF